MKISDLVIFILAIVGFVFGLNYMLTNQLGRSPLPVDKLIQTLKKNKNSDLNKALIAVTQKMGVDESLKNQSQNHPQNQPPELSDGLSLETNYESRINHVQFLLGRKEFRHRAIEYIESEIKTLLTSTLSEPALVYLDKLLASYFQIQTNANKSTEQLRLLKEKLSLDPQLRAHLKNYEALFFQHYQVSPNY